MTKKAWIPWWAKVGGKLILSRVPVSYSTWRRLGAMKHGCMDDPSYALGVFEHHVQAAGFDMRPGFVALELGPGDSIASAIISEAHGAARSYLVDVGAHARTDLRPYRELAQQLRSRGYSLPAIESMGTIEEILQACRAAYLTQGLDSLRSIPSSSVDFAWSHAVLEHIRRDEFLAIMTELRRILKPHGASSHRVDLEDHLGASLNSLRFSERVWESDLFRSSGFYTNRLRRREIVQACETAGYLVQASSQEWERLPLRKSSMAPAFREMPDAELLARGLDLVLAPMVNRHDR